ncbi:hypothetical protein KQH43_31410, partial [Streptomyces sp. EL5]|uniref:hypothetical protein n=1 Tax=Streptomyces sp. EL5 TaxID=2841665 RepID=UPI002094C0FE
NDWIALPAIRANDGALESLNVTAMKYRGLVEMAGVKDQPLIAPWLAIDGTDRALAGLGWHLADYWVPTGTSTIDGIAFSVTYAAPP